MNMPKTSFPTVNLGDLEREMHRIAVQEKRWAGQTRRIGGRPASVAPYLSRDDKGR
jgi:hypothetical protein